jgi:protein-S-isoprenylcysteine O-methyltransferase Ste14
VYVVRHLLAILALPTVVAIVVPAALLRGEERWSIGWSLPPPLDLLPPLVGLSLGACGLALVVATIATFATSGEGTLAPWDPPRRLVVCGAYRHVRNPMLAGVVCVLAAEAVFFGSRRLAQWCLAFLVSNLLYVPLVEEPGLERRFGPEYRAYKQSVPRWIPRLRPWQHPPR